MDIVTKRLFLLSHCKGVSNQLLYKLYKIDPTLNIFYSLNDDEWNFYFNVKKDKVQAIKKEYNLIDFDTLYEKYIEHNISFVSIYDEKYPYLLKEITDPPPIMYYKGDISLAQRRHLISVVGTRYPTDYGKKALEHLLKPLILANRVIVSGMAKGIDTLGHETAINNGGKTIAVIAGGLFHIYPKQNIPLANILMKSHLILSEHPPFTPPQKWHFPMRNRIISGLSEGTIIIQAKNRSGSLITAYQALEQNREVFAVPGSIFDECSSGTNELIQSGAKLVQNASHIIEEFPISSERF
ncbi:DNA-processing protein DprA [Metabacillus bambusae]|uniref:DNA-processing protein DprA n=1 Tax=Metabacillus bambusae TaxID=2795218 RepID=A0ABS3MWZ5_9BACI|nr:DNA-processing protein DprA [Metabacillus bambusae]MBO1510425.1 DNA-processing protein DprA [Metabacillus bambusae]